MGLVKQSAGLSSHGTPVAPTHPATKVSAYGIRGMAMGNRYFSRKGQSIVMLSLALPALLGCVSLAVDIANLYFNWAKLRSAADAAVLAGAGYLPAYPDKAKSVAATYAQTNGVKSSEIVSTTVAEDNKSLSMTLSRTVPYSFARVLGLISAPVKVTAVAGVQSVNEATGIVPLGLDYRTPVTFDSLVTLHEGKLAGGNWSTGPGNWDPLALGANGASVFGDNIMYGYTGSVTVGDSVLTETGEMKGPTKTSIQYRIDQGAANLPSGVFNNHELNDPRVILVPVVDFSNINGKSSIPVLGFAQLWLSSVSANGDITCYFIQQTAPDTTPSTGGNNYGSYKAVLIQ